MRFDELYLSDDILDAIDAMHFEECTPIQERTIPLITDGKDLIAVAQTGTGKTAAYLLPVIDEIANGDYPQDAINCIVMAPTRELAQQIDQQMQGFAYYMPVSSVAIYGGTDGHAFEQQKKGLKLGADVVIATPGRLIAHLSMGYVDLSKVSFLILDEADRMLDMGFYEDIMQIVKHLPKERQTLLFSATMPPKIKQLSKSILRNPAEVKLSVSKPADKIDQSAYICYETQKIPILRHVFKTIDCDRSIVFASSKLKCKELSKTLRGLNLSVGEMHSDLDQSKREEMLLAFKSGKIKILVATDIMARGIDIDDIGLVVNYDVPHENEDYVHRVGRTARANTDGIAITFVSEREIGKFKRIEQFIEKEVRKNEIPAEIGEGPSYIESKGRTENKHNKDKHRKNGRNNAQSQTIVSSEDPASDVENKDVNIAPDQAAEMTGDVAQNGDKKKRRRKKRRRSKNTEDVVNPTDEIAQNVETSVIEEGDSIVKSENVVEIPASDVIETPEPEVVSETADEPEGEDKKKKRRRNKKKKGDEEETQVAVEVEEEEIDLGPDPYGDRPISYSMVSAIMAAEARERAAREAAERDARKAAARKAAEAKAVADSISGLQVENKPDDMQDISTETVSNSANSNVKIPQSKRKRSPRKKKVDESMASESAEAVAAQPETSEPLQPKRKRAPRKKKVDESMASESAETVATQPEASEPLQSKRKRSPRKKKVGESMASESTEAVAAQPEASETPQPKRKRAPRKKKVDESIVSESAEAVAVQPDAPETPQPKKKRAPRKKKVDVEQKVE